MAWVHCLVDYEMCDTDNEKIVILPAFVLPWRNLSYMDSARSELQVYRHQRRITRVAKVNKLCFVYRSTADVAINKYY